jgi:outer membrane receptor protein involved in Fe transport
MRSACRLAALLFVFAAIPTVGYSQERSGAIEGAVKDSSGAILPGATVEARSPSLVGVQTAVADGQGNYRFPALTPGVYEITATLQGFTAAKVEAVRVSLGQRLKIDVTLAVASLSETVQVTAESPLIDVKQNAATATISAELIERLPKARDFTDLIKTAPGTQQERKSGIQIDGAGGSEHRYVIDGLDTTGIRTGISGQEMPTDFIEELQVKSSGYNAEFRATTGGVISAITKSGSNQWRGGVGYYFRSDAFNDLNRPTVRLDPADQSKAETYLEPEDGFSKAEPTFELGGPLLRNRMWFYAGYAPEFDRRRRTVTFRANGQTAAYDQNETDHNLLANVTTQLNRSMRLKVSVNQQRMRDVPGPTGNAGNFPTIEADGTSSSNPALFPALPGNTAGTIFLDTFDNFYTGSLDWTVSPKLFSNITVGLYDYGTHGGGAGTQLRHSFSASNLQSGSFNFPEIPDRLRFVNGYADFPSSSVTVFDDFKRHAVNADMTYFANRGGQHAIKAGVQYERIGNERLGGAQYPTINLFWGAERAALDGRRVRGTYGYYSVTRVYNEGDIHTDGLGLFLQDNWTVGRRVTLNLGVRTDNEEIPSYTPGNRGIKFGFKDKISPRVGFAWDILGDNKWKGYGSWGIFYDTSKLEMPRGLFGSEHSITHYMTLETFDWPAIQCGHPPVPGPNCPGTYIEQVDLRHAANAEDNFLIDPDLKPIRTREFTLGLDHELSPRISLGVRYSRKRFDRTIEDTGVLVPGIGEVYRITNPGESIGENVLRDFAGCTICPNQPKPTRNYDGVEFRLRKRLSDNWSMTTTYLYSRLFGNYSGLTSSDENNRNSPSVNRFFDGQYYSFDHTGQPVFGLLQTDRPHVFKIEGTYDLPWGTGLGVYWLAETGTPIQTQMSEKGIPFFPFGRNDMGRTPAYYRTDLYLQHAFTVWGDQRISVGLNVENLFDSDIVTRRFGTRYRDGFNVTDQAFFSGSFDPLATAAAAPASFRPDPRYGLPDQWQTNREVRLQVRFSF